MREHRNLRIVLLAATALVILSGCGGPHSGPENVVRAWVEAVAAGDCQKAASYYAPDRRDDIEYECGPNAIYPIVRVRIDEIVTRPPSFSPNVSRVTITGEIERRGLGTNDSWTFSAERIDGKWYFLDD